MRKKKSNKDNKKRPPKKLEEQFQESAKLGNVIRHNLAELRYG